MSILIQNRLKLSIISFTPILLKGDVTGYDIPGCMEDGAWMLWENSAAVVAHPGLGGGGEFGFSRNQITKIRPRANFCDLVS